MKAFREIKYYPSGLRIWHKTYKNISILAHWHNEIELVYIKAGHADFNISDAKITASAGDMVFCDTTEIHYCNSHSKDAEFEFLIFDESILSSHYQGIFTGNHILTKKQMRDCGLDKLWTNLVVNMDKESESEDMFFKDIIFSDIRSFFYRIARVLKSEDNPELTYDRHFRTMQEFSKTLSYISDNYMKKISLGEVANMLGFSESHFSKLFKKHTGYGFAKYLNMIRINNATEMLANSPSRIVDVSMACGYESVRNFNRVFFELVGCTPTEYVKNPNDYKLNFSVSRSVDGVASYTGDNPTINTSDTNS